MKKRLLALCLAAAMLLGMMPALTLPTHATEVDATTESVVIDPTAEGYDLTLVDDGGSQTYWRSSSYWDFRVWRGSSKLSWNANIDIDHSKEFQVDLNMGYYNENQFDANDGTITINDDGTITVQGWFMQINDVAGGSIFVNRYYTGSNDGTNVVEGVQKVTLLLPDGSHSEPITLNQSALNETHDYSIRWNIDGSVSILYNNEVQGTVANATWTPEQVAAENIVVAADGINFICRSTYLASASGTTRTARAFIYSMSTTHTEYLPVDMDSYFTAEELVADGALDEASWNHASFEDLMGIEAAVLVNKGVAYVALKGADGEASVTLGGVTKTATIAGGVAEVAFENAVDAYDEVAVMTVNGAKANVTFAANVIDPVGTDTTLTAAICGSAATSAGQVKDNTTYFRLYGKGTSDKIFLWYRAAGDDFAIDRSQDSKIHVNMSIQSCFFGTEKVSYLVNTSNAIDYSTTAANIRFIFKDEDTDTFFYPYLTGSEDGTVYVGFLLNDQTTNEYVSLGVSNAGVTAGDSTTDLSQLYFVWNTDGSVTVMLGDEVKGTVENATWTANDAYAFNRAQNPAFSNNVDVAADFVYIIGYGLDGQVYYNGLDVTKTIHVADIETSLADDINSMLDLDLTDLKDLPTSVEHEYFGTLNLTWSDDQGLVAENGKVSVPADDTTIALTAKVGNTVVLDAVAATVKAAEPVTGMFTTDVNAAWSSVEFAPLYGEGSVAVLAVNNNTVYVAVKSEEASATVALGGVEKTVSIENGMGVVAFENVALAAYGEKRDLSVATASGELTTKVVFEALQFTPATPGTTLTAAICGSAATSAGQVKDNTTFFRFYGKGASSSIFLWYRTAGDDFAIDRSGDSKIHVNMSIQPGFFGTEKVSYLVNTSNAIDYSTTAENIRFVFKDEDTDTFIYPYITGSEDGTVYVGFFLNDQTTNEYVSLGVTNSGVAGTDPNTDLSQLYFVWNVDGSVTVMLGDEVKGTVENATWTANDAYAFNRAQNPAFSNNVDVAADFIYIIGYGLANQAYYYGLDVTPITPAGTSNIELHKNDGYSLDLGSDIGFNFYIAENPGATITVNAAGEETVYYASELTATDGKYLIEANVAAAQMTENVSVKIVDAFGMTVFDATTTAKAYADGLLADSNTEEDALVNAMLNYGGAAQTYFTYMIDKLASETAPSDALLDVNADDYAASKDGELDGITVKSATLRLEEKVVIRYYFNADSVDGMTFMCGDNVLTAEQKSEGVWYVDVEVNPQNMATPYTVTVNDALSVTYSCMTYMTKYAADADAELVTLLKAMYDYYYAAVEYLA